MVNATEKVHDIVLNSSFDAFDNTNTEHDQIFLEFLVEYKNNYGTKLCTQVDHQTFDLLLDYYTYNEIELRHASPEFKQGLLITLINQRAQEKTPIPTPQELIYMRMEDDINQALARVTSDQNLLEANKVEISQMINARITNSVKQMGLIDQAKSNAESLGVPFVIDPLNIVAAKMGIPQNVGQTLAGDGISKAGIEEVFIDDIFFDFNVKVKTKNNKDNENNSHENTSILMWRINDTKLGESFAGFETDLKPGMARETMLNVIGDYLNGGREKAIRNKEQSISARKVGNLTRRADLELQRTMTSKLDAIVESFEVARRDKTKVIKDHQNTLQDTLSKPRTKYPHLGLVDAPRKDNDRIA